MTFLLFDLCLQRLLFSCPAPFLITGLCVSESLVFHLPISPSDVSCAWFSFRLSYRRTVRNPGMAVNCPVPELLPCAVRYKDLGHVEAITGPVTWTQTQISVRLELRTQKRHTSLPFSGPHGLTQPLASSPMPQPRGSLLSAVWKLTTQWWLLCASVTGEWKDPVRSIFKTSILPKLLHQLC